MAQIPTEEELQDFALNFEDKIVRPLAKVGYDKYNVFDILNISRQELRHSDFLAFLLDPNKSGEIGWQFLRIFLTLLSKDITPKLNFFDMLYGNIDKVNVYREVAVKDGRIDILIDFEIFKEKNQKIVIAIENKVDTGEHDNQLKKYKEFLSSEKYKAHTKVMLYLSPDSVKPSDNDWIEIDYKFIYAVLSRLDVETVDSTLKTLVNDYKKTIRREFGMENNDELRQKAIEIYRKNRQVLDFIYKCKPDWIKETSQILCKLLEEKGATIVIENSKGELVESKKKDPVNIMFIITELVNYKGFYFQICVDEMSLLFINDAGKRVCKKQWLFGDSQKSAEAVKRYQELVFDTTQLKADCIQMLEQAVGKDGIISYCLSLLKKQQI